MELTFGLIFCVLLPQCGVWLLALRGNGLKSLLHDCEVATMRILLQPPRPDAPSLEVDFEIQKALVALHGYSIRIRGAGRFGDGAAAIVLQRETDTARALAALKDAGIRASTA